jgi:CHAT domain
VNLSAGGDLAALVAAADRLLTRSRPGRARDEALAGICEALYHAAGEWQHRPELVPRLASWAARSPAASPWLALARLAALAPGEDAAPALAALDAALAGATGRPALALRTEAARHLWRLTGNAGLAWRRLARARLPDPALAEAAVEAVVVRLRLAALAADWDAHDRLAASVAGSWAAAAGPAAALAVLAVAEHEVQRGGYAGALERLGKLAEHADAGIRLAALGVSLHALLACGGERGTGEVGAAVSRAAAALAPLLASEQPTSLIPQAELAQRRARCLELLRHTRASSGPELDPDIATLAAALAREPSDKAGALALVDTALRSAAVSEIPEIDLRLRLTWTRLVLEIEGEGSLERCEDMASAVLAKARGQGLIVLEMLASDQRATVRLRAGRWREAVTDAGAAANLAVLLVDRNRGSFLERALRADLMPVLDRAIELLAEGALRARRNAAGAGVQERFGKAILDYAEHSTQLALTEARFRIGSPPAGAGARATAADAPGPRRLEDLQAHLGRRQAVLQYFLVGRHLLVFAYGSRFFAWHAEASSGPRTGDAPPIRDDLAPRRQGTGGLPGLAGRRGVPDREVTFPSAPEAPSPRVSPGELRRLTPILLPAAVAGALAGRRIRHLAIVPHDVLYRVPFGQLGWHEGTLAERFTLTLHPTGWLAGRCSTGRWRPRSRPARLGFFIGPGLIHARSERQETIAALRGTAEVVTLETETGQHRFEREAAVYDALYLACHGSAPAGGPGQAHVELGPPGQSLSLSQVSALDLSRCGLAVLQSCWTGWMDHLREDPVQGFPQGLLDAGVAAVIAPMFPVHDALCPVFAVVFCRALAFLAAGEALGMTLAVLARHGAALTAGSVAAADALRAAVDFNAYEYRCAGDPKVRLDAGWIARQLARLRFRIWLGRLARPGSGVAPPPPGS